MKAANLIADEESKAVITRRWRRSSKPGAFHMETREKAPLCAVTSLVSGVHPPPQSAEGKAAPGPISQGRVRAV